MASRRTIASVMFLAVLAGCATHSMGSLAESRPAQWTGSFRTTRVNAELGRSVPNSGFGSISLTPIESPSRLTKIELTISVPVPAGEHVPWAVLSGTCGSAHPMLAGESEFPPIEIGENGSGSVRVDMAFTLDVNGSYHANVYWPNRSRDVTDAMMCANLSYGGR